MMKEFFQKCIIDTFDNYLMQVYDIFRKNTNILKQHSEELEIIKKALERPQGISNGIYSDMICGSYNTKEETLQLLDSTLIKDYFTKEFINEDATNTKKLYVVNGENMTKHLFKKGNEWKEVKVIEGKNYLFLPQ